MMIVELQEDSLRDQIESWIETDKLRAALFSKLLNQTQKLKKYLGKSMSDELYITKSNKLEKIESNMEEIMEETGDLRRGW